MDKTNKFMLNTVKDLKLLGKPYTRPMTSVQKKFFYLHFYFIPCHRDVFEID